MRNMPGMGRDIEPGMLVRIIDDNGSEFAAPAIYLGMIIPGEHDLGVSDLIGDLEYIDLRFSTHKSAAFNQFFYAIPEHWHYILLVGGRVLHLNAGFYTLVQWHELDPDGRAADEDGA